MKLLSLKRKRLIWDELMDPFQQSSLGNYSERWTEWFLHTINSICQVETSLCFQFGVQVDGWDFSIVKYACLIIIPLTSVFVLTIYISWMHRLLITRVLFRVSLGQAFIAYFRISKVWTLLCLSSKFQERTKSDRHGFPVPGLTCHYEGGYLLLNVTPLWGPPWWLLKLNIYSLD